MFYGPSHSYKSTAETDREHPEGKRDEAIIDFPSGGHFVFGGDQAAEE